MSETIIMATSNKMKIRNMTEFAKIICNKYDADLNMVTLEEIGIDRIDCDEPYTTYSENSEHKADVAFNVIKESHKIRDYDRYFIMTNDSGLEISLLNNWPGHRTARCNSDTGYKYASNVECILTSLEEARLNSDSFSVVKERSANLISSTTLIKVENNQIVSRETRMGKMPVLIACEPMVDTGDNGKTIYPICIPCYPVNQIMNLIDMLHFREDSNVSNKSLKNQIAASIIQKCKSYAEYTIEELVEINDYGYQSMVNTFISMGLISLFNK